MIWRNLPKAYLQRELGDELLARLEAVIPYLTDDEHDPELLFRDHVLGRLFDAFAAPRALRDKQFRRALINSLPESTLDALYAHMHWRAGDGDGFSEKQARLSRSAWKRDGLAGAFVEVLDLPLSVLPLSGESGTEATRLPANKNPLRRLKDYQHQVYTEVLEALQPPNARVVMQMPTGAGKTRTAVEVLSAFLDSGPGEARRVAWLAHSSELCDQASQAFEEVWAHYAPFDLTKYRHSGQFSGMPQEGEENWIWFSSLQKAFSLSQRGQLPKADLVVIDEAHKVLAPTYSAAVLGTQAPSGRILGLTATPGRALLNDQANQALADFFFGRKVGIRGGEGDPIGFLRKKGVLSTLRRELLQTSSEVRWDWNPNATDVPKEVLLKLGRDDLRSVQIAKVLARHAEEGRSCLLFATSVENSEFIVAALTFLGIRCAHVDGETPRSDREAMIRDFRDRKIQVLSNFGVLSTGFDAPKIDVVCIARPTTSVVLYSQMLGRGLRGPAIGGTEKCILVDVRDNVVGLPDEESIYHFFDDYFV